MNFRFLQIGNTFLFSKESLSKTLNFFMFSKLQHISLKFGIRVWAFLNCILFFKEVKRKTFLPKLQKKEHCAETFKFYLNHSMFDVNL